MLIPVIRAATVLVLAARVVIPAPVDAQTPSTGPAGPAAGTPTFEQWLDAVRADAVAAGLRSGTLGVAMSSIEHLDIVLTRDTSQAEFVLPLDKYLERRVRPETIRTGRDMVRRHRSLLRRAAAAYGVDAPVLVSVWGLESNFGRFAGVRPTLSVLATLGYDARRGPYFRRELLDALRILDRGHIDLARLRGSWAGAMGQPQFMPSSYLRYAVDFDGDGDRDIWGSPPDVFASIANYLKENGWNKGARWGREVKVSEKAAARIADEAPVRQEGCRAFRELTQPLSLAHWQGFGVRLLDGARLPRSSTIKASLLRAGARAFLVYPNYEVLLRYNCANSYAISVGVLADRLAGQRAAPRRKSRR